MSRYDAMCHQVAARRWRRRRISATAIASDIRKTAIRIGAIKATTDMTTAVPSSMALTTGLPTPPVDAVTSGRNDDFATWTPPATERPSSIATMGLIDGTAEV